MLRLLGTPHSFPDLPQRWDGVPVRWLEYEKQQRVSHLEHACGQCGSDTSKWHATGLWAEPGRRHVHGRYCAKQGRRGRCAEVINFRATRCGWCGHTTVYTMHDSQSWELDDSDYAEHGSFDKEEMETLF